MEQGQGEGSRNGHDERMHLMSVRGPGCVETRLDDCEWCPLLRVVGVARAGRALKWDQLLMAFISGLTPKMLTIRFRL